MIRSERVMETIDIRPTWTFVARAYLIAVQTNSRQAMTDFRRELGRLGENAKWYMHEIELGDHSVIKRQDWEERLIKLCREFDKVSR